MIMTDRIKDIIKSKGENISTIRVENVVKMHPKIEMAAVFGVPHKKLGEAVVAAVVPQSEEDLSEAEVLDFCREKLASFEMPRKVVFMDQLPISVGTKVQKYKLREQYKDLFQE
jgi:acyl-CoA synthetase (AMP-forming)/AMP-acid ligase II